MEVYRCLSFLNFFWHAFCSFPLQTQDAAALANRGEEMNDELEDEHGPMDSNRRGSRMLLDACSGGSHDIRGGTFRQHLYRRTSQHPPHLLLWKRLLEGMSQSRRVRNRSSILPFHLERSRLEGSGVC